MDQVDLEYLKEELLKKLDGEMAILVCLNDVNINCSSLDTVEMLRYYKPDIFKSLVQQLDVVFIPTHSVYSLMMKAKTLLLAKTLIITIPTEYSDETCHVVGSHGKNISALMRYINRLKYNCGNCEDSSVYDWIYETYDKVSRSDLLNTTIKIKDLKK